MTAHHGLHFLGGQGADGGWGGSGSGLHESFYLPGVLRLHPPPGPLPSEYVASPPFTFLTTIPIPHFLKAFLHQPSHIPDPA